MHPEHIHRRAWRKFERVADAQQLADKCVQLRIFELADFGVAHMPASSVTMTGMIVGSPKYLSPEQVLGRQVDGRADIFSLGVVLYELLTGRTPFDSPEITVFTLMHRTVSDPAPPPSDPSRSEYRVSAVLSFAPAGAANHRGEASYNAALHRRDDGQIEHLDQVAKRL